MSPFATLHEHLYCTTGAAAYGRYVQFTDSGTGEPWQLVIWRLAADEEVVWAEYVDGRLDVYTDGFG